MESRKLGLKQSSSWILGYADDADEGALQEYLQLCIDANENVKLSIAKGDASIIHEACHSGNTGSPHRQSVICWQASALMRLR